MHDPCICPYLICEIHVVKLPHAHIIFIQTTTIHSTSMTTTLRWLLFLVIVTTQLHNSSGTQRRQITRSAADNSTQPQCQKTLVDISIAPPRAGCSSGVMQGVPTCSGACNSYTDYQLSYPYKVAECSCCSATTYKTSKRTVSFRCGNTNETVSYSIAAVIACGCSTCTNS